MATSCSTEYQFPNHRSAGNHRPGTAPPEQAPAVTDGRRFPPGIRTRRLSCCVSQPFASVPFARWPPSGLPHRSRLGLGGRPPFVPLNLIGSHAIRRSYRRGIRLVGDEVPTTDQVTHGVGRYSQHPAGLLHRESVPRRSVMFTCRMHDAISFLAKM
jgi:hypothetical protein